MLLLYCIFIIELRDVQFWWLFSGVWLGTSKKSTCWLDSVRALGRCVPWGGGWAEVAFCHLGVLPCPGAGLAPSWHKSNGLCIAHPQGEPSSCSPSALLLVPVTHLTRKLCQRESTARLHLKSPSSHHRDEEMSLCSDKAFLLPLVCACWICNGPAVFCCSITRGPGWLQAGDCK